MKLIILYSLGFNRRRHIHLSTEPPASTHIPLRFHFHFDSPILYRLVGARKQSLTIFRYDSNHS